MPGSDVLLADVMTNPLRTGLIATLREMGAAIVAEATSGEGGEPMAGLRVRVRAAARRRGAGASARPR